MNLGDQFSQIIESKMQNVPVEKVGDVFIDGMEVDSNRGVDPTGKSYDSYEDNTIKKKSGQTLVNLRDTNRSIETSDNTMETRGSDFASTRIAFSGTAGRIGKSKKPASEVFAYHQGKEVIARGGKQRKVFPEQEDVTSSGVQEKLDKVDILLTEYFNE